MEVTLRQALSAVLQRPREVRRAPSLPGLGLPCACAARHLPAHLPRAAGLRPCLGEPRHGSERKVGPQEMLVASVPLIFGQVSPPDPKPRPSTGVPVGERPCLVTPGVLKSCHSISQALPGRGAASSRGRAPSLRWAHSGHILRGPMGHGEEKLRPLHHCGQRPGPTEDGDLGEGPALCRPRGAAYPTGQPGLGHLAARASFLWTKSSFSGPLVRAGLC